MKKILCILLSLLLVLLNGCSSDTGNIRFGAAGVGGMYYTFANSFTGILSKENENYSYEVKNTAGSTANIRLLSNHYIDLAIAQADLIQDAYEGTGAFDGNICKDYSAIAGLYTEACQIVGGHEIVSAGRKGRVGVEVVKIMLHRSNAPSF